MEKKFSLWTVEYDGPGDEVFNEDMIDISNNDDVSQIFIRITNGSVSIPIMFFDCMEGDDVNEHLITDLRDDGDYIPGPVLKAEIERVRARAFAMACALNEKKIII